MRRGALLGAVVLVLALSACAGATAATPLPSPTLDPLKGQVVGVVAAGDLSYQAVRARGGELVIVLMESTSKGLSLGGPCVTPGITGHFVFANVPAGTYAIGVSDGRYPYAATSEHCQAALPLNVAHITVVAGRTLDLHTVDVGLAPAG